MKKIINYLKKWYKSKINSKEDIEILEPNEVWLSITKVGYRSTTHNQIGFDQDLLIPNAKFNVNIAYLDHFSESAFTKVYSELSKVEGLTRTCVGRNFSYSGDLNYEQLKNKLIELDFQVYVILPPSMRSDVKNYIHIK